DDGTSTAPAGDSLVLISTWLKDGRWQVESVVPFGQSQVSASRHYADQAQLFADGKLKNVPFSADEVMAEATQIERPGKPPPKGNTPAPPPSIAGGALSVSGPASAAERQPRQTSTP